MPNAMNVIYTLLELQGVAVLFTKDMVDAGTVPPELYSSQVELAVPWGKGWIVSNISIDALPMDAAPVEIKKMRIGGYLATYGFSRRRPAEKMDSTSPANRVIPITGGSAAPLSARYHNDESGCIGFYQGTIEDPYTNPPRHLAFQWLDIALKPAGQVFHNSTQTIAFEHFRGCGLLKDKLNMRDYCKKRGAEPVEEGVYAFLVLVDGYSFYLRCDTGQSPDYDYQIFAFDTKSLAKALEEQQIGSFIDESAKV